MKRGISAALVALLLFGCSSEPDVDWDRYSIGVQKKLDIDRLADAKDCDALRDRRAEAREGDLLAYVKHKLEEAGC